MPRDDDRTDRAAIHIWGDDILGISFDEPSECRQAAEQLRQTGFWIECVTGIESVAVQFDAAKTDLDRARHRLLEELRSLSGTSRNASALLTIPVCYGKKFGPDFAAVCEALGLSGEQVVELHTAGEYTVDMLGFTPGFAYIGGLPEELNVPRLARPRQRVAAGSVGIADGRSGLYALPGPGGWPLIGRTPMRLFDASAAQPILLRAGMRVQFRPIDAAEFRVREQQ